MSSDSSTQEILDHPTHVKYNIITATKRKLPANERKELEEFITSRGILIEKSVKSIFSRPEKLAIKQGSEALLDHYQEYKKTINKEVIEDTEMTDEGSSTVQTNKAFSEEEVLQLISTALQQQEQRQQQQQQQQPQQQYFNNQIRIPTPPTYNGTRDVTQINNWYTSVEHYLNFYSFEKARWVSYAVSLLTDHARLWYYRMAQQINYDLSNWESFKIYMDMEFKPKYTLQSTRDRLFELKQTSTVQHYIKEFQNILLELNITDDEAMDKFARGLKDRVRAHVLLKDPLDLEGMYQCARTFESATQYGRVSTNNHSSSSTTIDDPMDLSVIEIKQQNQILLNLLKQQTFNKHNHEQKSNSINCFYCDKVGHKKIECRNKKWDEDRGIFQNKRSNSNSNRYQKPQNNFNRKTNNYQRPNNFRQQLNALLDQYDPLTINENHKSNQNTTDNSTNNSTNNKNLIDLSSFDSQDYYSYPVLKPDHVPETHKLSPSDRLFLNNLDSASNALPLYKTMVGGSTFKILIDSGASTNYVHPKLISHALTETDVLNQAVETADGKQTNINKKITFRLFLGDNHEYQELISAYVFESKFDIILGRNWLKETAPKPDWFNDTWELQIANSNNTVTIHPIQKSKITTINSITPCNQNDDTTNIDYLVSATQVARWLKKDQITECFVVNFVDENTGNHATITPISPIDAKDIQLDKEWKEEFSKLFPYAFKGDVTELPPHRHTRDIIVTDPKDAPPIFHQPYRMSPLELNELKKQLADLEKKGLIVPTASPYGFPILFVRKAGSNNADGTPKLRMCCDFRSINKITIAQRIPIPRIDECLDQLHNSTCFSQIDLIGAFNQVRLSESDSMKATISHRFGQHRFLVAPFGLKNSGPYFQDVINKVLKQFVDKFVIIYVDDLLIYSKNEIEHKEHVKQVLKKLDEAKFIINIKKSHFNMKELTFLGYHISKDGIAPSQQKTEAIQKWPVPTNVQHVRQFLGLTQYYRRFIPRFAHIASPLTDLTAGTGYKTRSIVWTTQCQVAFDLLKQKLSSAPILLTPDMHKPFRIECDSSDFAAGAVLLQQDDNSNWKPLAFESKRYSKEERVYPAQEREMLAILIALRKWRCFIDGKKYTVFTDHLPLKYYRDQKHPVPRLVRWMSEIELYNPDIQYKAGKENIIPDLLSRRDGPNCVPANTSLEPKYLYNTNTTNTNNSSSLSKPIKSIKDDPIQDWPLLYFREEEQWPPLLTQELLQNKNKFVIKNQHIYKKIKNPKSDDMIELKFIPFHQRADLINNFHIAYGHLSQISVFHQLKSRIWWPGIQQDITDWLKSCQQCQLASRAEKGIHHSPMKPLDIPPVFSRWHLDFIGELPTTKNENRWILVAVDYSTNWPIIRALKNATGDEIVRFIYEEIVLKFGNPVEIFTDRGANFMSKVLKQYMNKIRSKHTFTSAYHPRSNSKCERLNQVIKNMLKKYVNGEVHSWDEYIDTVTFACRIRKHTTTGYSPFFLVYGTQPRIPGDFHRPYMHDITEFDANLITEDALTRIRNLRETRFLAEENLRNQGIKDKERWDDLIKGKETQTFKTNDFVLLRHESKKGLEYNWMGPYQVINCNPDFNVYQIKEIEGNVYSSWVHTDRLKPISINSTNTSTSWYIPRIARVL